MQRLIERFVRLTLFSLLTAASGQAAAWYPPYGYQPSGQYPRQYSDNRDTGQPAPYRYQYRQQAQQTPRYDPPRIETLLSDATPYEQQSLIYRIRVVGNDSVKSVMPVVPQSSAVVLRALGEPVTVSRHVTEYRYLLMPLSDGVIEIPPARVTGRFAAGDGNDGPPFDVSGEPVVMQVQPATEAVQPWLPLYDLQITARLGDDEAPTAGNPIELEVETRAVGATGAQIPSVAGYLKNTGFRIYPGESSTEGAISADGETLHGRRLETFTLVPHYGGWQELPGVTINWWNVRYNRPEVAALLADRINVMGPANPGSGDSGSGSWLMSALFWLPMGIAVGIAAFGWVNAFMGAGRLPGTASMRRFLKPLLGKLYTPLVAFANRVSPRRHFHRLRTWTGRQLPVSWKLWFCLRAVAREDDPAEWAQALQILAAKHLGVRPNAHLRHLGEGIVRCHPRANAAQVDALLAELDAAVYGDKPMRSFPAWKRQFKQQIKPGLFPIRFRQCGIAARVPAQLPGLNPR